MALTIGVLMDAINTIKPYKDSTFAMMLAAQARGHRLFYFQQTDVYVAAGTAYADVQAVTVADTTSDFYSLGERQTVELSRFAAILMRKDPPFDMEYIYTTYVLEMAEQQGTLIVNPPAALRAVNEKFYINYFPNLIPKTLVSRDMAKIKAFIEAEGRAVVKPMDGMGGTGIFKVSRDDANTNAILEALGNGTATLMVQAYLDKISEGDKRILLVDSEPAKYGLARIPQGREFRANLATGGKGVVQALTKREFELCEMIKPTIQQLGINVTSPTCIREIEAATDERIADQLIVAIENRLSRLG